MYCNDCDNLIGQCECDPFGGRRAPSAPAAPQRDPLDVPLPCDVTVGGGTFRKGVRLSTFVEAARRWHRIAYPEVYTLTGEEKAENLRRLQALVDGVQEPIPDRVYWAPLADNFYDADGKGQGNEFYLKWKPRRAEFPQGEAFGFGKGSAHNPFKDAPRSDGVPTPDGGQHG